jgi:hypothetical protein
MARDIPISGVPLLVYKLRHGGLNWLLRRLHEEWQMPRTAAGQRIYRGARAIGRGLRPATTAESDRGADHAPTLYAFYDLGVAPITFDFLWFLVAAELVRLRLGLASIHVVIVPGRRAGLRREDPEYEKVVGPVARRGRVSALLMPACALLPSVSGMTAASSREQARDLVRRAGGRVFPARYEPALPTYPGPHEPLRAAREEQARIGPLRAVGADLEAVDHWLAARGLRARLVTITLRSYGYMPDRNSNVAAWVGFARRLDPERFSVVFVPDTSQCLDGIPEALREFPVFSEAALVLGLRMALYERAFLNLGVNNGPMGLCWLNDRTRYITFKMLTETAPQATPEYMGHLGFEIGASLPGATPWQKWVWENDDLAVIEREFAVMAVSLESAPRQPSAEQALHRLRQVEVRLEGEELAAQDVRFLSELGELHEKSPELGTAAGVRPRHQRLLPPLRQLLRRRG